MEKTTTADAFILNFIPTLIKEKIPTLIYLANGVKLSGRIVAFVDGTHPRLMFEQRGAFQLVYIHNVSTIMPDPNTNWGGPPV